MPRRMLSVAFVLSCALLAQPARAQDAIPCASLPNPVYGIGGSAQKPTVGDFAAAFRAAEEEVTLIYASPGACFAMSAFIDHAPITGTASYWEADGAEGVCTLPLAGVPADFGIMGNAPTTCPGVEGLPPGVGAFEGAVLGWSVLVPASSTQQVISSEALYFVYGFGAEGQVAPWVDPAQLFSRNGTSAAGIAIARAAGLPVERLGGVDVRTNGAMITQLAGSTQPEAAIGFVSGDVADRSRDTTRALAYQHVGQRQGYWPDSTATRFDKLNIREGRYWLWTSTTFYAPLDASGQIAHPGARRFIDLASGRAAPTAEIPSFDLLIQGGNVPRCAMHVTRAGDYTELLPYTPPVPCDCAFEAIATGATSCAPCDDDSACAAGDAPFCRFGYCEAY